jgi:uncharacterized protein (DUF1810 family)
MFDLERFILAQDADGIYDRALKELQAGRKQTHWMWFVFPQVAGLGRSATSRRYAISSLEEAAAYVQHPVLGPRLIECSRAILAASESGDLAAEDVLGPIDALKLRSSMTLFHEAAPECPAFEQILERFFEGQPDAFTIEALGST